VSRLSAAFDLATLSSRGESFPNAVGEAMACGVPVAATDVGDVRFIVGDTGLVVPAGAPHALATAWCSLLAESGEVRKRRGEAARARIRARFDLRAVVASYETLYEEILLGSPPKKG
jgi:glycosyltransferase involved in cell wall biosynthesis